MKQFSNVLRAYLLGTGVRVTNIEPGLAETSFSLNRFKGDAARAAKVYEGANPLTADDIAETVLWAATQPPRVNINHIEVMPTTQAPGVLRCIEPPRGQTQPQVRRSTCTAPAPAAQGERRQPL